MSTGQSAPPPAGTDPLAMLRDLQLPPPPSGVQVDVGSEIFAWPQLLVVAAAVVLSGLAVLLYRRRYRLRRTALREVRAIALAWRSHGDAVRLAAELSAVLRRVVRLREPVAATLHGAAWLDYLDACGGRGAFAHGPGALLADGPFLPPVSAPSADDGEAILALVIGWLQDLPADARWCSEAGRSTR